MEIDAPPEQVWEHVIGFERIEEEPGWIFQAGIAYPVEATIEGAGAGAVRRCTFSTGAFVEPITVWDKPRRLAFDVAKQPPALQEWSPYSTLSPPHLDGYFRSVRGEFRLVALPDGGTRLEGSTWYTQEIYPEVYWSVIAEALIHRIHGRVLTQIKNDAEEQ